jgi:hypothetical protein
MSLTRRELLAAGTGAVVLALECPGGRAARADAPPEGAQPLGVVINSYTQRVAAVRGGRRPERFEDALVFLEHCHALGARGVQVGIGVRNESGCEQLRARAAAYALDLEGIIRLPRDRDDLERFCAEVRSARRSAPRH